MRSAKIIFIISILSFASLSVWFYCTLEYEDSPLDILEYRLDSTSSPEYLTVESAYAYIPHPSIFLLDDIDSSSALVEFLYKYKYRVGIILAPRQSELDLEVMYFDMIELTNLGDLGARTYQFKSGPDLMYLLFEFGGINEFNELQYMISAVIPQRKLTVLMTGSDMDVPKSLDIIRMILYNDPSVKMDLIRQDTESFKS